MAEIRQSLSLIAQLNSDKDDSQTSDLQEALAQREQTIEELQSELSGSQTSLQLAEREQAEMKSHLERVERQLAKSQSIQPFNDQLKQNAIDATGGDDKFRLLLEELNIDRSLPIDITRAMEAEFRQLLNPTENDLTIYDLIREASEGNELPDDAIGLAHLIRKQRNIIAHQEIHRNTYQAWVILCMFAAALLWPEFPEWRYPFPVFPGNFLVSGKMELANRT